MQDSPSAVVVNPKIYVIRGHRVMLDTDLAALYGVPTFRLNEQVKRNRSRFPFDFMFQLIEKEWESLRSQFAILESERLRSQFATIKKESGRGRHRKYLPFVFTEHGVAMLSSVLRSDRAIQVNIEIMRAFVRSREVMMENQELAHKLAELEGRVGKHDEQFRAVFEVIRRLLQPGPGTTPPRRRMGI